MGGQEGAASTTHSASCSSSSAHCSLVPSWPLHTPPWAPALCWLKTVRVKAELRTSSVPRGPALDEPTASCSSAPAGTGLGLHDGVGQGGLELSWLVLLYPHAPAGYWELPGSCRVPPIMSVSRGDPPDRRSHTLFQPRGQGWIPTLLKKSQWGFRPVDQLFLTIMTCSSSKSGMSYGWLCFFSIFWL